MLDTSLFPTTEGDTLRWRPEQEEFVHVTAPGRATTHDSGVDASKDFALRSSRLGRRIGPAVPVEVEMGRRVFTRSVLALTPLSWHRHGKMGAPVVGNPTPSSGRHNGLRFRPGRRTIASRYSRIGNQKRWPSRSLVRSSPLRNPTDPNSRYAGGATQHNAVFETLDGYTVVRNPHTGIYEIAQLSDDGTMLEPVPGRSGNLDAGRAGVPLGIRVHRDAARAQALENALRMAGRRCDQRRQQSKALASASRILQGPVMAPPRRETVGQFVGLCLLIDFPDEQGTIPQDEVDKFCNQSDYRGFGNNGSVHDYFLDNSIGRCRYTNIVTGYYRARHEKSHYTDPKIRYGTRARQLITEALAHLRNSGFDFSPLTTDYAGYVYALNVYYVGELVNNWGEGLWPHAWHPGYAR